MLHLTGKVIDVRPEEITIQEDEAETENEAEYGAPVTSGRPSKQDPPAASGIYRIVAKENGVIHYVGVSKNLAWRRIQHALSGKYNLGEHHFYWQRAKEGVTIEAPYAHERRRIDQHRPGYNYRSRGARRWLV